MGDWTFFSNYGHVLVCLANDNEARLRDVAASVGITERAAQKIVKDMQEAGYLTVSKHGRRNRYRINKRKSLRHGLESHCNIGKLLTLLGKPPRTGQVRPMTVPPEAVPPVVETDTPVPEEVKTRYPSVTDEKAQKERDKNSKESKDKGKKPVAVDTREQGSLF